MERNALIPKNQPSDLSEAALEARRRYYRKNKAKWRTYAKKYRQSREGQLRTILQNTKSKARRKGEKFELSLEDLDFLSEELCPILGIRIDLEGNPPAIARKDSSKPYTRDNCVVVSKRAYDLLSDGTLEEFEKIVSHLRNILT